MEINFRNGGFTLIELLVVVAIIGLLSSIVMTSLNSARFKAKDTAVKQGVREFQKLLEMEYNDTGSYANLQKCSWIPNTATCNSVGFSGVYASKAIDICNNVSSNATMYVNTKMLFCNGIDYQHYSIMAALSNSKFFCVGSSGGVSDTQSWTSSPGWISPGCYNNP